MKPRALGLGLALLACSDSHRDMQNITDLTPRESLTGAWDAQLTLTHPYPLGSDEPASGRICGTIGFVENHRASPDDDSPSVGVYDLDLSRLGLHWLGDDSFPSAVATMARRTARTIVSQSDSVRILLNPGSSERIVLLGRHDLSGIDGTWTAQSARGTATGLFSLRPHAESVRRC
jgi:hypothetical protein